MINVEKKNFFHKRIKFLTLFYSKAFAVPVFTASKQKFCFLNNDICAFLFIVFINTSSINNENFMLMGVEFDKFKL